MGTAKDRRRRLVLRLPDEYLDWCASVGADPAAFLIGFIADVSLLADERRADGYASTGKGGRALASGYCFVAGYGWRRDA